MMKTFYRNLQCAFISLLIFFPIISFAKSIVLGTTEWPPYVMNGSHKGYAYDIVLAAFKEAGYDDIKIIFMPWADAEKAAEDGTLDGLFPEYYSQDRQAKLVYTDSFSDSPLGFYKKVSSGINYPVKDPHKNLQETLELMKEYRFGVVNGYVNCAAFDNDKQLQKVYVDSDALNLRQLYDGSVDLIFIDKYTAEYLLTHVSSELPPGAHTQLVFMNPPLAYKKLYVSLSKKNSRAVEIANDFNRGLAKIKRNGVLTLIIDRDAAVTDEHVG